MPLVPAKCPSCGGDMQIDGSRKEAFCPYCGSKFLVESAVNYYNTKNEYHIEHADIKMEDSKGLEAKLRNAETYLSVQKDYFEAQKAFFEITKSFSHDWRGWWGLARARTCEFRGIEIDSISFAHYYGSGEDWTPMCYDDPETDDILRWQKNIFEYRFSDIKKAVASAFNVMDQKTKAEHQPVWDGFCQSYSAYLTKYLAENKAVLDKNAEIESKQRELRSIHNKHRKGLLKHIGDKAWQEHQALEEQLVEIKLSGFHDFKRGIRHGYEKGRKRME